MKQLSRREFIQKASFASLSLAALGGCMEQRANSSKRPNVIILLTDDQGYGDMSCHGNPHLTTPAIDSFAQQSTEMDQFYVCPVCAPTRASLMTGRYNYRTGAIDTYVGRAMMYNDEITLAEVLKRSGYQTGIFGKWHLGDNYPLRPQEQGFDEVLVHRGGGIGQPSDPPGNHYQDPILLHNGKDEQFSGYCMDIYTDHTIRYIRKNKNRPFFIYLATNTPHTPLEVPDEYAKPFREMGLHDETARTYGMIKNIDDNFGRILDELKKQDLEEDTIVIFLTDNGSIPEPTHKDNERHTAGLRGWKGSVYENGIRVPCFLRWPGKFRAGLKVKNIAAHIDIMPTLLEACSIPKDGLNPMDGRNLIPLLTGSRIAWPDRHLVLQWHRGDVPEPNRAFAIRNQRYKLLQAKGAGADVPVSQYEFELYDIRNDPSERDNLASQHPEIVKKMLAEYLDWFEDVSKTRGYAPPNIYVGTKHENPVILTRQDWRGANNWTDDDHGYWYIDVRKAGRYDIKTIFPPRNQQAMLHLKVAGQYLSQPIQPGQKQHVFENLALPAGETTLDAYLVVDNQEKGMSYVYVERL